MPQTALPPTPVSSTDLKGQDGTKQLLQLQTAFELPPSAMDSRSASLDSNHMNIPYSPESQTSPKTPFLMQPSEAVKSRRRSSATTAANKDNSFALPPPPTRSRKIIQMKPRPRDEKSPVEQPAGGKGSGSSTKRAATTSTTTETAPSAGKKKKASTNSAAGRKTARKTAHSLIERRRRSKMNEEFSVLKDMIPACTGEMHKLAILQASIDYVRYLHDCIERLKAQGEAPQTPTGISSVLTPPGQEPYSPKQQHPQADRLEVQHSPDVEMTGSDVTAPPSASSITTTSSTTSSFPPFASATASHQAPPASPDAWDTARRHGSYSSVSSAAADHRRHYSYSGSSAAVSPAFGPQTGGSGWYGGAHTASGSTLTSPALGPLWDRDLDQEATAALLLLSSSGRKETGAGVGSSESTPPSGGGRTGRGMSVRDLLSA